MEKKYGIVYEPGKWNDNSRIRRSHNCYAYAMNDFNPDRNRFPQPGIKSNMGRPNKQDFVCPIITERALNDVKTRRVKSNGECPIGYRKVMLFVDPYTDYHFYREDDDEDENGNKLWSHKPGSTNATNKDDSGNLITDPRTADRNIEKTGYNYTDHCLTYCVPIKIINLKP